MKTAKKRHSPAGGRHRRRPLSLLSFFTGRVTLSGNAEDASEILNLCMYHGLDHGAPILTEDGRFCMTVSYASAAALTALASNRGLSLSVEKREGVREALLFCIRRPGIPLGALLAVLLLFMASTHLWEIRVTGNTTLSKSQVVRELSDAGLSLGAIVSRIDVDSIENRLLMDSEQISWISVNLIGTVAEVQIREKDPIPKVDPDLSPANLVARCDGVIASCEVLEGNLLVKVGTAVRAGEVLVSGLYDSNVMGYRYTRAAGAIYAETEHSFEISVPYAYEQTECTEEIGTRCKLWFFGKELSLFRTGAFREEEAPTDTVGRITYLSVFGHELPVGLFRETAYGTEVVTGTYTPERAMEIAYYRLSEEIAAIPGMRGLLEKSVTAEIKDDEYILKCTVRCIENIAETKNIEMGIFE